MFVSSADVLKICHSVLLLQDPVESHQILLLPNTTTTTLLLTTANTTVLVVVDVCGAEGTAAAHRYTPGRPSRRVVLTENQSQFVNKSSSQKAVSPYHFSP